MVLFSTALLGQHLVFDLVVCIAVEKSSRELPNMGSQKMDHRRRLSSDPLEPQQPYFLVCMAAFLLAE